MRSSKKKSALTRAEQFNKQKVAIICLILVVVGTGIVLISRASIPVYKTNWAFWGPRIKGCESGSGPLSGGNYTAQNSISTASGAYQFLDSTWNNYKGFPKARLAPPDVQEEKAYQTFMRRGTQPWDASYHCWKTDYAPEVTGTLKNDIGITQATTDLAPLLPGDQDVIGDAKNVVIVNTPPADGLDPWVASPIVQFLRLIGIIRN